MNCMRKLRLNFLILASLIIGLIIFSPIFNFQNQTVSAEDNIIEINFFYSRTCPHCAHEKVFLEKLEDEYPEIKLNELGVFEKENVEFLLELYDVYNVPKEKQGFVPITFINGRYFSGFYNEETTGQEIENYIQGLITGITPEKDPEEKEKISLPIFGEVDFSSKHPFLLAALLGGLDGFNACAMVALGFLLAVLVGTGLRKRVFLIGGTFILVSGIVYFFFISAWLNLFLYLTNIRLITIIIGVVVILFSISVLRDYFRNIVCKICEVGTGKESLLNKFQKKFFEKMEYFSTGQVSLPLALLGISIVAAGVNMVELFCSLGMPVAFTKILTSYNLSPLSYYFYILIYVIFYMIDDFLIFVVAVFTLRITQASHKYLRTIKLISGLILLLLGLIMIFRPELLNF